MCMSRFGTRIQYTANFLDLHVVPARSEPEALPFCALAYALSGIIATALVAMPPVASALLAITA